MEARIERNESVGGKIKNVLCFFRRRKLLTGLEDVSSDDLENKRSECTGAIKKIDEEFENRGEYIKNKEFPSLFERRRKTLNKVKRWMVAGALFVATIYGYHASSFVKEKVDDLTLKAIHKIEDRINPPQVVASTAIEVNKNIERYTVIRFDEKQSKRIIQLAAVELDGNSTYTYVSEDKRLPDWKYLNLRDFFSHKEFTITIPSKVKSGFDLTGMIDKERFAVADNEEKKIIVRVPPVEILSIEPQFEKVNPEEISQKEGIFADVEVSEVIEGLGVNQTNLRENLLNREELKKDAFEKSKQSLSDILSVFTSKGNKYEEYKIEFQELNQKQADELRGIRATD